MSGKPTTFPASFEAVEHWAEQAIAHLPPASFAAIAEVTASTFDHFAPHAVHDLPDTALDGLAHALHMPDAVHDWLLA